jgi:uncharacterized protein YxjI
MRYLLKQKLFAFGDDFHILNENDEKVFFVDGRAFSLGNKLSFQDLSGNELVFIRQKLLSFGPSYELHRGGQLVATLKKNYFTLFHCKFAIDVPGPDDLEAKGDFLDHEYVFTRSGREVAQISKRWFAFSDTYGVDIGEGQDDVLILASAVVIDMICHDEEKH